MKPADPSARPGPDRGESPFPLFPGEPPVRGPVRVSTAGRKRALVLGAVHVLILLHVTHWLVTGSTLSPVEPSESMETLELGLVNAGFVFFVLATVSTAVFGRFVCGWGCHVIALQDLCAAAMRRIGIRPRPFRSRLLAVAPLALALYMFVWPTFRRVALQPFLEAVAPGAAAWFAPAAPFPGFSNHLVTRDFWESFPSLWVAVPFLALCGFGVVYLLGAKGFCTYGCPYGAVFGAADTVAPGRIRVTDACNGCAHCTVTCTSNVRVHDEVREYGMVVDPGCMKCQDCVSVCPTDALYFGFGKPAAGARPKRRLERHWDLSRKEDLAYGGVMLGAFLAFRGVYDTVPLLFAIGIAAAVTFLVWKGVRVLRDSGARHQQAHLKRDGRITRAGAVFLAAAAAAVVLTVQSGIVRASRTAAARWDDRITVTLAQALSPDRPVPSPAVAKAAARAEAHYARADRWGYGGIGLLTTPEIAVRRAWIATVEGRWPDALRHLDRAAARAPGALRIRLDRARVRAAAGDPAGAVADLRALVAEAPAEPRFHSELADILEATDQLEDAVAARIVHVNLTGDPASAARLADLLERLGRPEEAERYRRASTSLVNRPGGP